jgi:hypothetical protein
LLQAISREVTRGRKGRGSVAVPEVIAGNGVRDFHGRRKAACPLLDAGRTWVGLNGNGKRRGLGYRLLTTNGWLARAGYGPEGLGAFLDDLEALGAECGLVAVAVGRGPGEWHGLQGLRRLSATPAGHAALDRLHLRIYGPEDYLARWSALFGWPACVTTALRPVASDRSAEVQAGLRGLGMSLRELARALEVDASFLSKIFNGKKPWPEGLLRRAQGALERRSAAALAAPTDGGGAPSSAPAGGPDREAQHRPAAGQGGLETALACLRRGWSVLPQRPLTKCPFVRWADYQDRRPTEQEVRRWFARWPEAGVEVVLGPVSGLLVIDVDGAEALSELVGRLGGEPVTVKSITGKGDPSRFHLFFRHPDGVVTSAKATPWHPNLELRGHGGLIVLPPSVHPSGRRYAWAPGRSPDDLDPAETPAAVREALAWSASPRQDRPAPSADVAPVPASGAGRPAPSVTSEPVPCDGLTVLVAPSTRDFLAGRYADGPGWNDRLFRAACDLCGRGMSLDEAEPLLLDGALPYDDANEAMARRTIASAFARQREPGRA